MKVHHGNILNSIISYYNKHCYIATSLGPYFGRTVLKDQVEGEKHNKWLWEVSFVVALLLLAGVLLHIVYSWDVGP